MPYMCQQSHLFVDISCETLRRTQATTATPTTPPTTATTIPTTTATTTRAALVTRICTFWCSEQHAGTRNPRNK